MTTAMILAAGRGERMRPLSDACPKPLLMVGGKPLIVWQIEALARAGFRELVINAAHRASQLTQTLGDGSALGVRIAWSLESEALETAGGIATAMPLIPEGPLIVVSGDIWTDYDYASLQPRAERIACDNAARRVHLVMVPNPPYHPAGDFALDGEHVRRDGPNRLTFGNIGIYDSALFRELPRGAKLKLLPLYHEWIAQRQVSGERFDGAWVNVGTPADLASLDSRLAARRT
ncbi:MAG: nucleotidyltransferase family protein [Burkholderiales bacterium]|nr:nucleotidyltransferase family protein [Burkholderiales bacterium]